jgi:hypothetical protein
MKRVVFDYKRSIKMTTDWTVVVIVLVFILGGCIIYGGDSAGGILVILAGCALFVPLYLNAKLVQSALCVDDEAITAIAFGHNWKSMRWVDVKEVRFARWRDPGYSKPTKKFSIYSKSGRRFYLRRDGPMVFNDTITNSESLLNVIHDKARVHGFTIAPFEG